MDSVFKSGQYSQVMEFLTAGTPPLWQQLLMANGALILIVMAENFSRQKERPVWKKSFGYYTFFLINGSILFQNEIYDFWLTYIQPQVDFVWSFFQ